MAENMTGTSHDSWGGRGETTVRVRSFTRSLLGRLPSTTRVSMGSRSGSMDGLVTCEALMRILSQ